MTEDLKTIDTVDMSPFKKLVMTIGELPTSFVESMTYYEALAWLVNYLENQVIPAVNNNAEAVKELQDLFIELKNFVDSYFDNLDVQDEIDNKLDEMASDGTLQEIITTYIQSNVAWTFDTVADMKQATNLIDGSYARTLGFHTINDGGGALYHITDSGTANEMDVIAIGSTLYANLVLSNMLIPEQFGAYGDNTHDDTSVLQYVLNYSGINHVSLSRSYKISTGLDISDWKIVDGGGVIHSSGICLDIDGHEHLVIRDLRLYPTTHAIRLYSDNYYSNYNIFEDIFCYGADTDGSKGLFIEVTNRYMNEFTFRNCVFWNFNYGIYALNNTGLEMSKYTFTECSTETSTVLGQYIKNGDNFTFNNCRHVESISNKWKTEGNCSNLIINGVFWMTDTSVADFSSTTNGQIINGLRYFNELPINKPNRNGFIKKGYVIPCKDGINWYSKNVNSDTSISYGDDIITTFKFGSGETTPVTLTLPSTIYGLDGGIDEFYFEVLWTNGNSIVKIDTTTIATIPPVSGYKLFRAKCISRNFEDKWVVFEETMV